MKGNRLLLTLITVLTVTAAILTGCGGSGSGTSSPANQSNTSASTYNISGTVTSGSGGMQGVTMTLTTSNGSSPATVTDANGHYTFTGLSNGQYTLTPSASGATFTPANMPITLSGADSTGNTFTASAASSNPGGYSISGIVTRTTSTGLPLSGAAVTLSGPNLASSITATADANGNYSFSGLSNGTYTLTPSYSTTIVVCIGISTPGGLTKTVTYSFSPVDMTISITGADSTGMSFVGTSNRLPPFSCPV